MQYLKLPGYHEERKQRIQAHLIIQARKQHTQSQALYSWRV